MGLAWPSLLYGWPGGVHAVPSTNRCTWPQLSELSAQEGSPGETSVKFVVVKETGTLPIALVTVAADAGDVMAMAGPDDDASRPALEPLLESLLVPAPPPLEPLLEEATEPLLAPLVDPLPEAVPLGPPALGLLLRPEVPPPEALAPPSLPLLPPVLSPEPHASSNIGSARVIQRKSR
jgi:hypothetical protein